MSARAAHKLREGILLLVEWKGLEMKLRAHKVSTKAIRNIKRVYLRM